MSDENLVLRVGVEDDASGPFRRIAERVDDVEDAFRRMDRAAGRAGRAGLGGLAGQAGVAERSIRASERAVRTHRTELGRFGGESERTGRRFSSSFATPVTAGTGRIRSALTGLLPLVSRAALVFGAAAAAGGLFIARTIGDLQNIERIGAQTDAAIRSTGGVANVTRTDIDTLANSLERLSGTEAETITAGANMLLTFTKVRNEIGEGNNVFDRATALGLDMSVALGQDAAGSALQLGKALNDPVQGVTALRRAGVSFTAQQLEQIKVMQESGDLLGAQRLVLSELETQFGGSAAALGATDTGKLRRIANTVGNIAEAMVGGFLPQMSGGIDWILGRLGDLEARAPEIGARIGDTVTRLGDRLGDAFGQRTFGGGLVAFFGPQNAGTIRQVLSVLEDVGVVLRDLFLPVIRDLGAVLPLTVGPLGLFRLALGFAADNAEALQPWLTGLLAVFAGWQIIGLFSAAIGALNVVMALNPAVLLAAAVVAVAAAFIYAYQHSESFRAQIDQLGRVAGPVLGAIATAAQWIWDRLGGASGAVTTFATAMLNILVPQPLRDLLNVLERIVSAAQTAVGFVRGLDDGGGLQPGGGNFGPGRGVRQIPRRLHGGPVWPNLTYLSGERGPELLSTRGGVELLGVRGPEVRTAREPGVVIPAAQTGRMLAGAGPTTVNLTVPITTGGGDWVDRAALAAAVRAEIGRQQRNRVERTTRHQR